MASSCHEHITHCRSVQAPSVLRRDHQPLRMALLPLLSQPHTPAQAGGRQRGSATQVMLAEELGLRNFLNIDVVYTRKLAQSITCLSLPGYYLVCTKTDTAGEVIFGGLASLQTSLLSGCRAWIRAYFRLRQQYQNWPRALNRPNPWTGFADTPEPIAPCVATSHRRRPGGQVFLVLTQRAQPATFSGRTCRSQAGCRGSQVRASRHSHHAGAAIGAVLRYRA
jgi:hypothetical protein